jgi:hypothetical protein
LWDEERVLFGVVFLCCEAGATPTVA